MQKALNIFWEKNSSNIRILEAFGNKVQVIKSRDGSLHIYAHQLINAIFSFMSKMKKLLDNDNIDIDILPDYIKKVINSLDKISPTEMFIHTNVINRAAKQLETTHKIDFKYSESRDFFQSLSDVLQSEEQEKYNLQQKNMGDLEAARYQDQDSYFTKDKEKRMQSKGYSSFYVRGLDYINETLKWIKSLYAAVVISRIDPYTTHMPEFASLINVHIAFIETGIEVQGLLDNNDKMNRLKLLKSLKLEAEERQESRSVTYLWWFNFNLRLAILVTPQNDRNEIFASKKIEDLINNDKIEFFYLENLFKYSNYKSDNDDLETLMEDIYEAIKRFPDIMMIPTIREGFGIISLNRAYGHKVQLISLRSEHLDIDGVLKHPDEVFVAGINRRISNRAHLFNSSFERKLRELDISDRKAVEWIYFKLTNEEFSLLEIINLKNTIQEGDAQYADLLNLLPDTLNKTHNDVKEFIARGERVIIRLILEVSEEYHVVRQSSLFDLPEEQIISLYSLLADHFLK